LRNDEKKWSHISSVRTEGVQGAPSSMDGVEMRKCVVEEGAHHGITCVGCG